MSASKKHDRILNVVGVVSFILGAILVFGGIALTDAETQLASVLFAAIPATLAALAYFFLAPWNKTTLGRILMSLIGSLALLLDLTVGAVYIDLPGDAELLVARLIFLLTGVVSWVLLTYIALAQLFPPSRSDRKHFTRQRS